MVSLQILPVFAIFAGVLIGLLTTWLAIWAALAMWGSLK